MKKRFIQHVFLFSGHVETSICFIYYWKGVTQSLHCVCLSCPSGSRALCVWAAGPGSYAECAVSPLLPTAVPLHTLPPCTRLCWNCGQTSIHGVCVLFIAILPLLFWYSIVMHKQSHLGHLSSLFIFLFLFPVCPSLLGFPMTLTVGP